MDILLFFAKFFIAGLWVFVGFYFPRKYFLMQEELKNAKHRIKTLEESMSKRIVKVEYSDSERIRLLKSSIDEIKRALIGNKSSETNEIYLRNAVRFIEKVIVEDKE